MYEIKEKRRIRKLLFSKITILGLFVVFILLASATWSVFGKYRETRTNRINAEENLSELQERTTGLEEDIARLKTPRGVEGEIRENFGLVKEGETMVVIVEDDGSQTDRQSRSSGGGLLGRFWGFIFGN